MLDPDSIQKATCVVAYARRCHLGPEIVPAMMTNALLDGVSIEAAGDLFAEVLAIPDGIVRHRFIKNGLSKKFAGRAAHELAKTLIYAQHAAVTIDLNDADTHPLISGGHSGIASHDPFVRPGIDGIMLMAAGHFMEAIDGTEDFALASTDGYNMDDRPNVRAIGPFDPTFHSADRNARPQDLGHGRLAAGDQLAVNKQ